MTKVNVISGFLGAGKTTLIAKLLKDVFAGEKIVLVENEFGEIGIDGGFLKDTGVEISEINSGCICCTLKGDFQTALTEVITTMNPDRIIIEPSGVGKLSDILSAVRAVEGVEVETYSTIVDAKRCKIYHKNFKEFFDDQIESASCVILSRSQLVKHETIEKDLEIIRELNHDARIITTPWDDLSGTDIYDAMVGAMPEALLDEESECHCSSHHHHDEHCGCEHDEHHHHDEHCGCEHDEHHHDEHCSCGCHDHNHDHHHHHHADDVFTSIGIETVKKYDKEELMTILDQLDDNVVRAKGIVQDNHGGWLFFDFVPGDMEVRVGSPTYTGLITVIGEKLDEDAIKGLFKVN